MRVFIKINQQSTKAHEPHEPRIQGSRYAGKHFQAARTSKAHEPARHTNHTNQGYKVQGMQVITPTRTRTTPTTPTKDTRFKVCR